MNTDPTMVFIGVLVLLCAALVCALFSLAGRPDKDDFGAGGERGPFPRDTDEPPF